MKVVNLFGDDSDRRRDRPGWQWNHLSVGLYELEPGQKTFPYHWQYVEEEMLIVVDRGPEGAHQLRNDTDGPVRLLMLSTPSQVEIAEYPDSEKIGVFAEGLRLLVRRESAVDYFDGED